MAALWPSDIDTAFGSTEQVPGLGTVQALHMVSPSIADIQLEFYGHRAHFSFQRLWTGRFDPLLYWSRLSSREILFTPCKGTRSSRTDETQSTPAFLVSMVSIH